MLLNKCTSKQTLNAPMCVSLCALASLRFFLALMSSKMAYMCKWFEETGSYLLIVSYLGV